MYVTSICSNLAWFVVCSDKTPSAKKRRSSSTQGIGSPSSMTTPLKPALTERQQLALLLQMTDPQKTPGQSVKIKVHVVEQYYFSAQSICKHLVTYSSLKYNLW